MSAKKPLKMQDLYQILTNPVGIETFWLELTEFKKLIQLLICNKNLSQYNRKIWSVIEKSH